jgi:hypothetical protein
MDNATEQQHIITGQTMYKEEIYIQPIVRNKPETNINLYKPTEGFPSIKSRTLPRQPKDRKEEEELQVSLNNLCEKHVRYFLCFSYLEQNKQMSTTENHFTSKFNV